MIESLMFDEHDLVKRAATECMCNMVLCEEVTLLLAFTRFLVICDTVDKRFAFEGDQLKVVCVDVQQLLSILFSRDLYRPVRGN